jgi:methionyl-tRNA synthetase
MEYIKLEDFKKLKLKVGKIVEVVEHPDADKLWILKVEIGNGEIRTVVAGIKPSYPQKDYLIGKQVVILENLEPKQIRGIKSEGMILAASNGNEITILTTEKYIEPGAIVS